MDLLLATPRMTPRIPRITPESALPDPFRSIKASLRFRIGRVNGTPTARPSP
jgi:hypothetical protein